MPVLLQHLECTCKMRFTENVVGNNEYVAIDSVEEMFRHFRKKGHKPVIKRFWHPHPPKKNMKKRGSEKT